MRKWFRRSDELLRRGVPPRHNFPRAGFEKTQQ
jgi:hypothetical protein